MSDKLELENVAEQYRDEGYEVILRPRGKDLPDFLDRLEPDLIARNRSETVVVEIKTKGDLATDHHLRDLAAIVNAQPGWRFDLVVSNPQIWPDAIPSDASERDVSEIRSLTDSAARLLSLGELEAACLIAWSAAEAAMRQVARREAIELERNDSEFVLKTLYAEGILSRGDYEQLQKSMRIRNALAHGLKYDRLPPRMPEYLTKVVDRLLKNAAPRISL
jgi:uncharacterized protein YutE (UPF0331/DUF86 family)